jgi:hypothetical protein
VVEQWVESGIWARSRWNWNHTVSTESFKQLRWCKKGGRCKFWPLVRDDRVITVAAPFGRRIHLPRKGPGWLENSVGYVTNWPTWISDEFRVIQLLFPWCAPKFGRPTHTMSEYVMHVCHAQAISEYCWISAYMAYADLSQPWYSLIWVPPLCCWRIYKEYLLCISSQVCMLHNLYNGTVPANKLGAFADWLCFPRTFVLARWGRRKQMNEAR